MPTTVLFPLPSAPVAGAPMEGRTMLRGGSGTRTAVKHAQLVYEFETQV